MKVVADKSVWNRMKQNLRKGETSSISVGFFENDRYGPEKDNLHVAQVAKWNNEGTEKIPPRPFMSTWARLAVNTNMYNSYFIESMQKIAEGKSTFTQEYRKLGPVFKEDLQETIEEWSNPPNAPLTVELKGFNNPLIETETMLNAVGFKVNTSGSGED